MSQTILLIEDNALERDVFQEILVKQGYEVMQAETGEVGLEKIAETVPALVIIDTQLPGMDGLSVCRKIRALDIAQPKIIVTTGKVDAIDIGAALEAGADEYAVKTPDFISLTEMVNTVLRDSVATNGVKVLVIEDGDTVRDMLVELLADEGYVSVGAADGTAGLEAVQAEQPAVIILDTILPDINGFEVCKQITAMALDPKPKIIMTTSKVDAVDADKARASGADDYVVKTSDFSFLVEAVKQCC